VAAADANRWAALTSHSTTADKMQIPEDSYQSLLSMHNLALLSDWLAENDELFVDIDFPHSGGSGKMYIIHSLSELRELLAQQTWPEMHLVIFREKLFRLRGIVDEPFIAQAIKSVMDGHHYVIVRVADYPLACEWLDEGNSHVQLQSQLRDLNGEIVGIGAAPLEEVDLREKDSYKRVFSLRVSKNQNYYEPYAKSPEHYAQVEKEWTSPIG
jgi:hypothetical protein